jgi:predicted transcriptional regulator|tara:strand:+ start:400 stop:528 length:129 start_codon:yes stop_codon:yes gene_type:complete
VKKENTIEELLERLDKEIQSPKDSVHKIVLQTTIDNINKLLK